MLKIRGAPEILPGCVGFFLFPLTKGQQYSVNIGRALRDAEVQGDSEDALSNSPISLRSTTSFSKGDLKS